MFKELNLIIEKMAFQKDQTKYPHFFRFKEYQKRCF